MRKDSLEWQIINHMNLTGHRVLPYGYDIEDVVAEMEALFRYSGFTEAWEWFDEAPRRGRENLSPLTNCKRNSNRRRVLVEKTIPKVKYNNQNKRTRILTNKQLVKLNYWSKKEGRRISIEELADVKLKHKKPIIPNSVRKLHQYYENKLNKKLTDEEVKEMREEFKRVATLNKEKIKNRKKRK